MAVDSENENFISFLLFIVHFCGGGGGGGGDDDDDDDI
jgi:hypothetical protein